MFEPSCLFGSQILLLSNISFIYHLNSIIPNL
nr:MAG TPA: hypothetical protein [Caudoviricetes sp.]